MKVSPHSHSSQNRFDYLKTLAWSFFNQTKLNSFSWTHPLRNSTGAQEATVGLIWSILFISSCLSKGLFHISYFFFPLRFSEHLSPKFITAYLPPPSQSLSGFYLCLQYSSISPFYNVQTEGMFDVSRERQNKGDIIIPIVAFSNWDRENWLVQCQTESLCRAESSFPQCFPSAFLTQPSLCFLEEYHPPFSRLNTFYFLLLPFSLPYSFFLLFSLKYLLFLSGLSSL